ncbi:VOC family protein [Streptomyces hyaluromycini]|uniref:VOC family protein n=1 Tax=Streptomyces hyaluromycini TaxID=1377993 RepID=UPI000B5C657F|nr:VOC family protein [Streptomyces hyaluromycini]
MASVARLRNVVLDCPDPRALAAFYADVIGGSLVTEEDDWVVLRLPDGLRLGFQLAEAYTPPEWPRADRNSQQFHLDIDAGPTWADVDAAEKKVLALGARLLRREADPVAEDFRVFADPAGHPFCLCRID